MPPPPIYRPDTTVKDGQTNERDDDLQHKNEIPSSKSSQDPSPMQTKKKTRRAKSSKKTADLVSAAPPSCAAVSALAAAVRERTAASPDSSRAALLPQLASAMEASQTSQQCIHDWDRKFGLRRAHSKTMRESSRSRIKVLEMLRENWGSLATNREETERGRDRTNRSDDDGFPDVAEESIGGGLLENKQDADDDSLERMFRRASLDCIKEILPEENFFAMPWPDEARRRQFHANGA